MEYNIDALLSNKYAQKVVYASLKIRIIAVLVVLLISCLLFYSVFVSPVRNEATAVVNNIQSMKKQITRLIKKEKNFESVKQQIKNLKDFNINQKYNVPENISIPLFLEELTNAIHSSKINIINISPSSTIEKQKFLNLYVLNFDAKLRGDFSQLVKLFVALIDMKNILIITDIDIKKVSNEELNVDLKLQTYSVNNGQG